MFVAIDETPIDLEALDPHLKAILKTKIREFVHLHPCFQSLSSYDVDSSERALLHDSLEDRASERVFGNLQHERNRARLERLYLNTD